MFSPARSWVKTSNSQALPSDVASSSGEVDKPVSEQEVSFTSADLNLGAMSEDEYTQLQQILHSQIEAEPNESNMERTRASSAFYPISSSSHVSPYQSTLTSQSSAGCRNVHPTLCQPSLTPECSTIGSSQYLGNRDFEAVRMIILSESNMSLGCSNTAEETPSEAGGDSSWESNPKVRNDSTEANKEKENLAQVSDSRLLCPARVRLEDRFNTLQSEGPRSQEMADSCILMSLIHHPSQQMQMSTPLLKSEALADTRTLQYSYPRISFSGNTGFSHTQPSAPASSASFCPLLEAARQQEMSLPRSYPRCYLQELDPTKQSLGSQNKLVPEQVWRKIEETVSKQSSKKRIKSHHGQTHASAVQSLLQNIQNPSDKQTAEAVQGLSWPPIQIPPSKQASSREQEVPSQRREKHNRLERDRRRRIKLCCDELNLMAPFCTVDTDKATTLQWTTAFLKYMQEQHGDTLKKEFESVFCGKTGRRRKVSGLESLIKDENMSQSPSLQEAK
ncbi:transcription factor-like 5 protein [Hyperolius riggenbachi]|uniref:transcription factor-like 5 protein n=1 Tax=Hyperolius riggenbachi TaxID=752182 RepID=UPI0035A3779C